MYLANNLKWQSLLKTVFTNVIRTALEMETTFNHYALGVKTTSCVDPGDYLQVQVLNNKEKK